MTKEEMRLWIDETFDELKIYQPMTKEEMRLEIDRIFNKLLIVED